MKRPSTLSEYIENLKLKKIKLTDIRLEIIKIIWERKHCSINDIQNDLKQNVGVFNHMSIYNNIDMMLKKGLLFATTCDGKQIKYEIPNDKIIHIKCDYCDMIIDAENTEDNDFWDLFKKIGLKYNTVMEHYKVEIHGLCNDCKVNNLK